MKNILVLKHYKLKNITGWVTKEKDRDDVAERVRKIEQYTEMKHMCILSAKKFLLGLDDIIVHESEVHDIQHGFRQHFFDLYDIWKQKNVNILYADLDVLFIRPFNWFDFSNHFVMYMNQNSGIRYHGHDMDPLLWELAFEQCKSWDSLEWDYEQKIYMGMNQHWANPNPGQTKIMEYGQLVSNLPTYDHPQELYKNNKNCCAIHFHCTRGNAQFERMKKMFEFLRLDKELAL